MQAPDGTSKKTSSNRRSLYLAGVTLLGLALLVFVQAAFNLGPFITASLPSQILLLYSLSTFIFLVLIIFGTVLARSLFKLWVEQKSEKPGAKFKTRLVLSLIGLTLIPAAFLFMFAFGLVNRSIDKWFSVPVDSIFEAAEQIESEWALEHEAIARGILNYLAREAPENLDAARGNFPVEAIVVLNAEGEVLQSSSNSPESTEQLRRQLAVQLLEGGSSGRSGMTINEDGSLVGLARLEEDGAVLAARFYRPEHFEELTFAIDSERLNYNELIQNRRFYRDTYVYIMLLMTTLVLFAAVWTGLHLSKRITIPIEALAGATREISAGHLDYRVRVEADEELGMLVGLFNDMADQLQLTTRELDERRRYTEIILESIPTGVISIDDEYRVTKVNRALRTMFSIENAETLKDIFVPDDLDQIGELLRVSDQEGTLAREMTLKAHGQAVHSAVIASKLTTGGFVLVVEDLTEVVKAQKATAWREVARRLAHEIKNPLTPIQLSAERIARNLERAPSVEGHTRTVIQECVDAIVGEVGSLKELVNEFGRVARLPAIAPEPTPMKDLIDRTLSLYEDRFNGTLVKTEFPENMPDVLMDGQQIKRVLINLIDNALEAMSGEDDKELTIACELVRDETTARLTVTDTGQGVAPEDMDRLFAPYFSTRKDGTGLGLAIASRIVADHGGYIGAETNGRRGARFVVELPLCQKS